MRQLNNLKFMAMAMLVALMSMSFTACSDDDDDKGPDTNSIVGVWERVGTYNGLDGTARLQFNSNNTGTITIIYDDDYHIEESTYSFEYEFVNDGSDKTVTFSFTSLYTIIFQDDEEYDVTIMPSSLTIGSYRFVRK